MYKLDMCFSHSTTSYASYMHPARTVLTRLFFAFISCKREQLYCALVLIMKRLALLLLRRHAYNVKFTREICLRVAAPIYRFRIRNIFSPPSTRLDAVVNYE